MFLNKSTITTPIYNINAKLYALTDFDETWYRNREVLRKGHGLYFIAKNVKAVEIVRHCPRLEKI